VLVALGAHEVHGDVLDDGHVLRPVSGSEPCEVVVKDDVEDPMQAVLDTPVGAHGGGEGFGIELGSRQIVASFVLDSAAAFDPRLDHADHREMGKARLAGIAAVGPQPGHVAADAMAALFEAAVVGIGGLEGRRDHPGRRIGEETDDVGLERRPIALERQQIVAAAAHDGLGDGVLGSHGVDGDQRPGEVEPFKQQRDGGDLVGFDVRGLLAEHEALARRPGGDEVQRLAALAAVMRAPHGLAIDGDDLGIAVTQGRDPGGEAGLEEIGVESVDDVVQRVVRRQAALLGQEAAETIQALLAPQLDLDEVLHAAERRAEHDEQELRQRIHDAPRFTRIAQRREMVEHGDRRLGRRRHGLLRVIEAFHESHRDTHGAVNLKRLP
jgi:hypothetical protein